MTITRLGKRVAIRILNHSKIRRFKEQIARRLSNGDQIPTVRVAVIGAGKFALQHLTVLSAMRNVELVSISNRGNSDLSAIAEEFNIKATFSDYRVMLDCVRPDAAIVVASHFHTSSIASECLDRGIPCLIEKPAAFTADETERLARLAAKRDCLNMVGVNRRYLSTLHEAVTQILQRGELIGVSVEAPEAIGRFRSRNEHDERLYDRWLAANSIHAIDLIRCIGGDVVSFHGRRDCRVEANGDSFVATMRLSKGGLGTFLAHWLSVPGWSLTLYGNGVKAVLGLDNRGLMSYTNGGSSAIPVDVVDLHFKPGLFAQDEAFINAVALKERPGYPASDLADSAKTMRLIESIGGAQ
jgi:predicted dehydrogenase